MLAKADNRMLAGDHRAANAYYGQVGRLAGEGEPIAQSELQRAREATAWLSERFRHSILDGLAARGVDRKAVPPRVATSLAISFGEQQSEPVFQQFSQAPKKYTA